MKASCVERQNSLLVFKQNDAAFFNFARGFKSHEGIDDAALAGMIDDARVEHRTQYAVNMLVQFGDGDFASVDGGFVFVTEEEIAGLFVVESGGGRFFCAV